MVIEYDEGAISDQIIELLENRSTMDLKCVKTSTFNLALIFSRHYCENKKKQLYKKRLSMRNKRNLN